MYNVFTLAGDFLCDDIPQADLYILSHVIHSLNDQDVDKLLVKLFKKLPRGKPCTILND